jgi:hypothetical protein
MLSSVHLGFFNRLLNSMAEQAQKAKHDTVFVLQPDSDVFLGLNAEQFTQLGLALVPVALFIWWEFFGRQMRDRGPISHILYSEVHRNYRALQERLNDIDRTKLPTAIGYMEQLEFQEVAYSALRERIDVLPRPVPGQIVQLYAHFQRLPALQRQVVHRDQLRSPASHADAASHYAERRYDLVIHDLCDCTFEALSGAKRVVVSLHYLAGIEEDLRKALRDPAPRRASDSKPGDVDDRVDRVIITRLPPWLYPSMERLRNRWARRRRPPQKKP